MISGNFATFLNNSIQGSVMKAGICGLTSIANPKAAAIGSLASSVAGYAFGHVILQSIRESGLKDTDQVIATTLAFLGLLAVKIGAGNKVGRLLDKKFNYFEVGVSTFVFSGVAHIAAFTLGYGAPLTFLTLKNKFFSF